MADITTPVPLSQIIDRIGDYPAERKGRWVRALEAAATAGYQEEAEELAYLLKALDSIAGYRLLMENVTRQALILSIEEDAKVIRAEMEGR